MKLPKTRISDLLEQEADRELLLYDRRTNKMFQLNETSKIIYKACSEKLSFDELKSRSQFDDDIIYLTINELKANNLLETDCAAPFVENRRELIRRIGRASLTALPLVTAIVAPKASNAASGTQAVNSICTTETSVSSECQSGRCSRTLIVSQGGDGASNTTRDSGSNRCCAATNSGAGYESGNTYYQANDCSFASLCCSGSGSTSEIPNAKGYYTCTCA